MIAAIIVDVWKYTPFMAILLLAGLQVIPHELYEASKVDGANRFQQFWNEFLNSARSRIEKEKTDSM